MWGARGFWWSSGPRGLGGSVGPGRFCGSCGSNSGDLVGLVGLWDFVAVLGGLGGFGSAGGSGDPSGFSWACGAWWVWYANFCCFCGCFGYLIRFQSIFNGSRVCGDPKAFDDPQDFDDLKVISNESIDFDDPKEFAKILKSLMIQTEFQLEV